MSITGVDDEHPADRREVDHDGYKEDYCNQEGC
jgi:hypothetical protein